MEQFWCNDKESNDYSTNAEVGMFLEMCRFLNRCWKKIRIFKEEDIHLIEYKKWSYLWKIPDFNLPVNKLNHVIFFAAAKNFEPFQITNMYFFIFAKGNGRDDRRTWL